MCHPVIILLLKLLKTAMKSVNNKPGKLSKLLHSLDRFPYKPQLKYQGKSSYTTVMGGLYSVAMYVALAVFLLYQAVLVHQLSGMSTSTSVRYESDSNRSITIEGDEFTFDVRLQYYGNVPAYQGDDVYTLFSPVVRIFKDGKSTYDNLTVLPLEDN